MKPLKKGSTIGLFSPSSPATAICPKRYERAKLFLENKGFRIVEGQLTGNKNAYRSGTIMARAEEFNALIRDEQVDCIMSTIGGMNSNSILPYIDYDAFKTTPKIVVGYSDVTAILLALYAKTGISTFYGPACVASFGEFSPFVDITFDGFDSLLSSSLEVPYVFKQPEFWTEEFIPWEQQKSGKSMQKNSWKSLNPKIVQGRLIGGNLNTLQGFWGSEYMPLMKEGDILLIEDSLKNASTLERSFSFLKVNGVFDHIGGIVLGKHELFNDEESGYTPLDIMLEVLNGQVLPILSGFDACHTHPMITLPIGAQVELDTQQGQLSLLNNDFWKG